PLIRALRTALAMPPLFAPTNLSSSEEAHCWLNDATLAAWTGSRGAKRGLDLVDGAVIRQNPLPALFTYLETHPDLARRLARNNGPAKPAIHVVYRVPIEGKEEPEEVKNTIVDVARLSLRLSQRRDTQLEVAQTNFISDLQSAIVATEGSSDGRPPYAIFADEIAPRADLVFKNPLNPRRDEILSAIAEGCRCTLEKLYPNELLQISANGLDAGCGDFMARLSAAHADAT